LRSALGGDRVVIPRFSGRLPARDALARAARSPRRMLRRCGFTEEGQGEGCGGSRVTSETTRPQTPPNPALHPTPPRSLFPGVHLLGVLCYCWRGRAGELCRL